MVEPIPILNTRRLVLRPLELSDSAAVQASFPRWEIVRYLNAQVPWPYPPDGALSHIRDAALPAMAQRAEWHWSIRRKSDPDDFIGVISLMATGGDNRGFWLVPEWQGQGLMTEAVEAVTDFWFGALKMPVLRVPKAVANLPSRRISERSGMRVVGTAERDYVSGRLSAEIWEMTAEEWAHFRRDR